MRRLFLAAWIGLAGPAQAGGYLAGGLLGSPTPNAQALTGVPSLRLGLGSDQMTLFLSLQMARATIEEPQLTAFGAQPMLGVRLRMGSPDEHAVSPIATAGAYTRVWGLSSSDRDVRPPNDDGSFSMRPVVGGVVGGGLDARLNPNLSLSVELGVDAFTGGFELDGYVSHLDTFTTWSSIYVNIWL